MFFEYKKIKFLIMSNILIFISLAIFTLDIIINKDLLVFNIISLMGVVMTLLYSFIFRFYPTIARVKSYKHLDRDNYRYVSNYTIFKYIVYQFYCLNYMIRNKNKYDNTYTFKVHKDNKKFNAIFISGNELTEVDNAIIIKYINSNIFVIMPFIYYENIKDNISIDYKYIIDSIKFSEFINNNLHLEIL